MTRQTRLFESGMKGSGNWPPSCTNCVHFNGNIFRPACTAFPVRIPGMIINGEFDHYSKNFPGDGGVSWEPHERTRREVEERLEKLYGFTKDQIYSDAEYNRHDPE